MCLVTLAIALLLGSVAALRGGGPCGHAAAGERAGCRGGAVAGAGGLPGLPGLCRRSVLPRAGRLGGLIRSLLREPGLEIRTGVLSRLRGATALRGRLLGRGALTRVRNMGGVLLRRRRIAPGGLLVGGCGGLRRRTIRIHRTVLADGRLRRRGLLGRDRLRGRDRPLRGGVLGCGMLGCVIVHRLLLHRGILSGRLFLGHPEVPSLGSRSPGGIGLPAGRRAPAGILDRPVRRRVEAVSHQVAPSGAMWMDGLPLGSRHSLAQYRRAQGCARASARTLCQRPSGPIVVHGCPFQITSQEFA